VIELKRKTVFHGPNPFVPDPVLIAELSVALPLEGRAAASIIGNMAGVRGGA